ncbi:MFS transporter [Thermaerobacillus caldiproteolyticus]|uniref:MFS transporter n=1 Tax=Thermaerobacillus caldiproteolyticus TaxID=247480 RepID=UPI00188AA931|nr:MFS transporter [Anoxybacillus caldiproteolyticus]QPA30029.1 MFS transporter [Anoxybacillus caldiproteolyticus]
MKELQLEKNRSHYRWFVLFLATWIQAAASLITQGIGPLSTYWKEVYGFSETQASALVSAVNIGPILSMMFLGKMIDRSGERWILGICAVLLGMTMGGSLVAKNFDILFLLLIIVGVWYGASQPGGSKLITHWFTAQERGIAMGIRQVGIPFGGALGSAIIPWLATKYHVSVAILFPVSLSIISGLLFLLLYRDIQGLDHVKDKEQRVRWHEIIKDKKLSPVFLAGISLVSLQFILVAHFMAFLMNQIGMSFTHAGMYLSLVQLSGMIGRIVIAWISDNMYKGNRIRPLIMCICLTVVSIFFLLGLNENTPQWLMIIVSILLGFFGMGWYSLYIVYISENASENQIAYTVSIGLTLNQIAIVFAPFLFGIIVDFQHDYHWPWFILAVLIALAGVNLLKFSKEDYLKNINQSL